MTQQTNTNAPMSELRDGSLRAAIWKNQKKDGTGNYYSVTLSRTYKDDGDQYRDTNSFSPTELLRISRLAGNAYDEILIARGQHPDPEAAE